MKRIVTMLLAQFNDWLTMIKDSGVVYRNSDGAEQDMLKTLAENGSFEDEDRSMWTFIPLTARDQGDFQVRAEDAFDGEVALHFWDFAPIELRCEQTVTDLLAGTWRVSVQAQGDDVGKKAEIYLNAIADGVTCKAPVSLRGWTNWQEPGPWRAHSPRFRQLTVGVYVRCQADGWGTFDDFRLNWETDSYAKKRRASCCPALLA